MTRAIVLAAALSLAPVVHADAAETLARVAVLESGFGSRYNSQKTHCPHGHSYEDALVIVRHDRGGVTERRCRSCQRAQNRRRYRRSRGA